MRFGAPPSKGGQTKARVRIYAVTLPNPLWRNDVSETWTSRRSGCRGLRRSGNVSQRRLLAHDPDRLHLVRSGHAIQPRLAGSLPRPGDLLRLLLRLVLGLLQRLQRVLPGELSPVLQPAPAALRSAAHLLSAGVPLLSGALSGFRPARPQGRAGFILAARLS